MLVLHPLQEAADYEMRVRAAEERDARLASGGARGASSDDEEAGGNTDIAAAAQRAQELGKARRKSRRSGGSGSSGSGSDSGFGSSSGDDADAWEVASRAASSRSHFSGSGSHISDGSASSVMSGSESDAQDQSQVPLAPELVPVATAARLLAELEGNTSEHESYQQEAGYAAGSRSGEEDMSASMPPTRFDKGIILPPEPLTLAAAVLAKQQGGGASADGSESEGLEGTDVPWTGVSHHSPQPSSCCSSGALPDLIETAQLPEHYAEARAEVAPSDAWVLGSSAVDPRPA
jgi:hypothetical protein